MKSFPPPRFIVLFLLGLTACSQQDRPTAAAPAVISKHEHHPPHAGTPVTLGAEIYHLELVRDAPSGRLTAYVLDGEMENFVRITAPSFEVVAIAGGTTHVLRFAAVANSATGETVGNTSQFDAQADWLKTTPDFDATLTRLDIRGTAFTGVAFSFPRGNDRD